MIPSHLRSWPMTRFPGLHSPSRLIERSAEFRRLRFNRLTRPEIHPFKIGDHIARPLIRLSKHFESNVATVRHRVVCAPTDIGRESLSVFATQFQILALTNIFVQDQAAALAGHYRGCCRGFEVEPTIISTVYSKRDGH